MRQTIDSWFPLLVEYVENEYGIRANDLCENFPIKVVVKLPSEIRSGWAFRVLETNLDVCQWNGANLQELTEWLAGCELVPVLPASHYNCDIEFLISFNYCVMPPIATVTTKSKVLHMKVGNWVIRDNNGDLSVAV